MSNEKHTWYNGHMEIRGAVKYIFKVDRHNYTTMVIYLDDRAHPVDIILSQDQQFDMSDEIYKLVSRSNDYIVVELVKSSDMDDSI